MAKIDYNTFSAREYLCRVCIYSKKINGNTICYLTNQYVYYNAFCPEYKACKKQTNLINPSKFDELYWLRIIFKVIIRVIIYLVIPFEIIIYSQNFIFIILYYLFILQTYLLTNILEIFNKNNIKKFGLFPHLLILYSKYVIENKNNSDEDEHLILKQNLVKLVGTSIILTANKIIEETKEYKSIMLKKTLKLKYEYKQIIFALCCQLYFFENIENENNIKILIEISDILNLHKKDFEAIKDRYIKEEKQHQQRIEDAKRAYENYKHLLAGRDDSTFYYEVLGLSKDATEKQISRRFRELAVKYHPDKYSTETEEEQKKATEKFKEIAEAYNYLKDKLN